MQRNLLNSKKGKENLVVKIEPSEPLQPPTIEELIEQIVQNPSADYWYGDLELLEFLQYFEWYKMQELTKAQNERIVQGYVIEENFVGDWRKGQEIHKVVITQRLYQTSPTSTQA